MNDHLSDEDLQELKGKLEQRHKELGEDIRQELLRYDDEGYNELAGRVHDLEEESVADLLVDINLASVDHYLRELREVEEALERIRQGTYGVCVDTGEPIELARLRAYPTAKRSLHAQEIYEKTHAQAGGSRGY